VLLRTVVSCLLCPCIVQNNISRHLFATAAISNGEACFSVMIHSTKCIATNNTNFVIHRVSKKTSKIIFVITTSNFHQI